MSLHVRACDVDVRHVLKICIGKFYDVSKFRTIVMVLSAAFPIYFRFDSSNGAAALRNT